MYIGVTSKSILKHLSVVCCVGGSNQSLEFILHFYACRDILQNAVVIACLGVQQQDKGIIHYFINEGRGVAHL